VTADPTALQTLLQHCLIGLTNGSLIALIALGYTMVYGIIELVNFAHGDLFIARQLPRPDARRLARPDRRRPDRHRGSESACC